MTTLRIGYFRAGWDLDKDRARGGCNLGRLCSCLVAGETPLPFRRASSFDQSTRSAQTVKDEQNVEIGDPCKEYFGVIRD